MDQADAVSQRAIIARLRHLLFAALNREYAIFHRKSNLMRAFRAMDVNGSGHISRADWDTCLTRLGLWLPLHQRSALFKTIDADHDQLISIEDLTEFQSRILIEEAYSNDCSLRSSTLNTSDPTTDVAVEEDNELSELSAVLKRRRVAGSIGQNLQNRFRTYAVGDTLLEALDGLEVNHGESTALLQEEVALIMQRSECPMSPAEERWLLRTFTLPPPPEQFESRKGPCIDALALANFALGARDPWAKGAGGLEESPPLNQTTTLILPQATCSTVRMTLK
jgi:hypothetical protein